MHSNLIKGLKRRNTKRPAHKTQNIWERWKNGTFTIPLELLRSCMSGSNDKWKITFTVDYSVGCKVFLVVFYLCQWCIDISMVFLCLIMQFKDTCSCYAVCLSWGGCYCSHGDDLWSHRFHCSLALSLFLSLSLSLYLSPSPVENLGHCEFSLLRDFIIRWATLSYFKETQIIKPLHLAALNKAFEIFHSALSFPLGLPLPHHLVDRLK